jgi:hypothetical protein
MAINPFAGMVTGIGNPFASGKPLGQLTYVAPTQGYNANAFSPLVGSYNWTPPEPRQVLANIITENVQRQNAGKRSGGGGYTTGGGGGYTTSGPQSGAYGYGGGMGGYGRNAGGYRSSSSQYGGSNAGRGGRSSYGYGGSNSRDRGGIAGGIGGRSSGGLY